MSWRSALWDQVSLDDAGVTVKTRQTDTSVGAFDNAGAASPKPNRRAERRYLAAEVPAITAVTLAGEAVTLVNISSSGVLVESGTRIKPGERVRLEFAGLQPKQVGGVVVRCVVSAISHGGKLRYESAVAFSQPVNFPVAAGANAAPAPEPEPAASTPAPAPTAVPTAPTPTAAVSQSEEVVVDLTEVFSRVRNRW
jgi:hypothetical protein